VVKFSGDAQAAIRDVTTQEVVGGQQIAVREVVVDIPANVPIAQAKDQLTIKSNLTGETVVLEVRTLNEGPWGLGRYRYTCRYP
jgi:hypothetical protein